MFGYVIINKGDMKFKEFDIYHAYYCGLCRLLKEKYGVTGQLTLSYDMTFVIMLLSGLYEPDTVSERCKCIAHPFEKHMVRRNEFTEYAADINILLSYFKCMDDWMDDRKHAKRLYAGLLRKGYRKVKKKYGSKVNRIEKLMQQLLRKEGATLMRCAGSSGKSWQRLWSIKRMNGRRICTGWGLILVNSYICAMLMRM